MHVLLFNPSICISPCYQSTSIIGWMGQTNLSQVKIGVYNMIRGLLQFDNMQVCLVYGINRPF